MIKVLLVDDQNLVRQGIRSLLNLSEDVRVAVEADDGEQAIEILSQNPGSSFDLILLDVQMPRVDGIGVLEFMRQHVIDIPVIILTNKATQGSVDIAVRAIEALDSISSDIARIRVETLDG